ncbi:hypothetical protein QNH14_12385 [Apirhabdus apintestini]|nr:hypothetical protein QNH14_12385 [Enterobacteriaceae bacterium CA-0114]
MYFEPVKIGDFSLKYKLNVTNGIVVTFPWVWRFQAEIIPNSVGRPKDFIIFSVSGTHSHPYCGLRALKNGALKFQL